MNPDSQERPVRIRRKLKQQRYLRGKAVYKYHRLELTIPSKYEDMIEPFLNKDLKVEAKREGNNLIIKATPT